MKVFIYLFINKFLNKTYKLTGSYYTGLSTYLKIIYHQKPFASCMTLPYICASLCHTFFSFVFWLLSISTRAQNLSSFRTSTATKEKASISNHCRLRDTMSLQIIRSLCSSKHKYIQKVESQFILISHS